MVQGSDARPKRFTPDGLPNPAFREETTLRDKRAKMIAMDLSVVGTLTFYVNPEKKIYRISFVHSIRTAENSVVKNKGK